VFAPKNETVDGELIHSLGEYHPWSTHKLMGGNGDNWPEHSSMILGLKKGHKQALDYFYAHLEPRVRKAEAIAVVPGHEAGKPGTSGVRLLARRLAEACGCVDATGCLVRHTTIAKKATGGDRSKCVDLNSIEVRQPDLIMGRKVLLLDDVKTSGNSLLACRELLLDAGAAKVVMAAMARTTH
jgi:predicted amidophosphoribosyltransferase